MGKYKSRASRLSDAESMCAAITINDDSTDEDVENAVAEVEEARSIVEELRDEIENWKSGLEGTNLENTNKYQMLEEAYDRLEDIISSLEGITEKDDFDELESVDWSVDFPGMFD
ncbi:MAG TPA: hypothetical protein VIY48_01635 [Candidatus Paceibacterota bacterium]